MIVLYEMTTTPDGRVLLFGMDPTLTLCTVCHQPISEDYVVINIYAELGRLTHVRCQPTNEYEQALLGHPPEVLP